VQLPVYGAFSIAGDFTAPGTLSVKSNNASLFVLNHQDGSWQKVDSSQQGSNLEAKVSSLGTFVIVSQK
ncbi:hypothetical protein HY024_00385, partial [Candidatus Curtissbacteria bacterium]|nr:hypothetical protein [Candidatus Curtissbacteria bacterium]